MSRAHDIAAILLDLKAVSVAPRTPFTWASGLSSPIYCDNRLIISAVTERRRVAQAFCDLIAEQSYAPDLIAGTATAGIPHAAWIAEGLSLPMVYIRSSEKKHGKKNQIEGRLSPGARAVVVEDLISSGGSSIRAAQALEDAGASIAGVVAVFQYGLAGSAEAFAAAKMPFATLTNLDALLEVAAERGDLDAEELELMQSWSLDPKAWSQAHGKHA